MVGFYDVHYTPLRNVFEATFKHRMPKPETTYRSYLLRLWQSDETGLAWRAMLECVTEPGERHYFKDLESLVGYLSVGQEDRSQETEGDV